MRLYELPSEWNAIQDELEANFGELTPELSARIDALDETLAQKVDNYYKLIANSDATEAALKAEAKKLTDRAKTAAKNAETFKTRLQYALVALGKPIGEKIFNSDNTHYAALRENPAKVIVDDGVDAGRFPDGLYRHIPESFEPDKKALLDSYKRGEQLPSGVTIIHETSVTLK